MEAADSRSWAGERLPIFTLGTVLFPGGLLPLKVFEARYVDMTADCLRNDLPFGVCLIREGREVGAPALPESVGCKARIIRCDMPTVGVLHILVRGEERFRIQSSSATPQGLVVARITPVAPDAETAVPPEFAECASILHRLVKSQGAGIFAEPHRFDSAAWVGYRLAEVLPLPMRTKQKLLEMEDSIGRLAILHRIVSASPAQPPG